MSITNDKAQSLITMPKKIVEQNMMCDNYTVRFHPKIEERFTIQSLDRNNIFMLQIKQGLDKFKISLHFSGK